ncbi:bifunctional diguanylate cyclase/phosphodiesterase [Aquincola tertiaricarbonis]|uniref:Bifunctional diguanylate cyclase/phosphodiesterase n=1 Tax=Aquincola tertiaricarbonis TaxID=391953 RepID=A0ABY4SK57_AQUTE|nr:bifunctional diguanylate cyclase/phosphodiesterase [Aquincola tertiaricarbonis]URI11750.1 bifunctional diguanylate cyclase/phosphodiesterase [Aquincola tertiaricarbonis]
MGLAVYAWMAALLVVGMAARLPAQEGASTSPEQLAARRLALVLWALLAAVAWWGLHLMVTAYAAPDALLQRPGWLPAALLPPIGGTVVARLLHQRPGQAHRCLAVVLQAGGWLALPMVAIGAALPGAELSWQLPLLACAALALLPASALSLRAPRLQRRPVPLLMVHAAVVGGMCVAADLAVLHAAETMLEASQQAASSAAAGGGWAWLSGTAGSTTRQPTVLLLLALAVAPAVAGLLALAQALALRVMALHDHARVQRHEAALTHPLTSLPNRQAFEHHLQAAAMRADRQCQRLAVMCINVDGLKTINESFGPAAGDALLCSMARRLQRLAGPNDLVAHASGDEFLVLLGGNPDRDTAARAAGHAIQRLSDVLLLEAREVASSCSIGLAMYPQDGTMATLVTQASAAVRCAKQNGRASYCFFESHMTESSRDQTELLRDLRRAIERRQLELMYQPKVDARDGHITGVEALLRWRHPDRGWVPPVVFVPLAERAGLIGALGDWVIEEACRQMRRWLQDGLRLKVSINLSVHQLRQPDLAQRISQAMQRHQVPPGLLSCEITESAAMEDTGITRGLVDQLAAAGVPLSIDDFGTGYSSLGYLRRLPVSELKIDRSFVLDLATSGDACAIVDAVIRMAHALGLTVVAEGVETEAQRRLLNRLGCDQLQGYLYAKPMSARLIATWARDPAPTAVTPQPVEQLAGTHVAYE